MGVITIIPDAIGRRSALLEIAEVIDRYRAELHTVLQEGGVIDPTPAFDQVRRIVTQQGDLELAAATAEAMKARLEGLKKVQHDPDQDQTKCGPAA